MLTKTTNNDVEHEFYNLNLNRRVQELRTVTEYRLFGMLIYRITGPMIRG